MAGTEEKEPDFYKPSEGTAFQAATLKLPTRSHKMDKDHEPPELATLDRNNMPSPTALKGMQPGIEQILVHGTQTTTIDKDRKMLILQNETREVMKNQDEVIHVKTTLTHEHGREVTVGDDDDLSVNGIQEIFVTGESEATYLGKHEVTVPWEFEKKFLEAGATAMELKFLGVGSSVKGRESEIKISGEKEALFESFMEGFHEEATGQKGEAKAMGNKVGVHADANVKVNPAPEIGLTHIP